MVKLTRPAGPPAPSAYSQYSSGAMLPDGTPPFITNTRGRKRTVPPMSVSESAAAFTAIVQGASAASQVMRNTPPVVSATGDPSEIEYAACGRAKPPPLLTSMEATPYSIEAAGPGGPPGGPAGPGGPGGPGGPAEPGGPWVPWAPWDLLALGRPADLPGLLVPSAP